MKLPGDSLAYPVNQDVKNYVREQMTVTNPGCTVEFGPFSDVTHAA